MSCCSTSPPTTSTWKPCAPSKTRCSNSQAAWWSSPTTAGSSTASPPTSSRRKAIPSGRSSMATTRNTKLINVNVLARKEPSQNGYATNLSADNNDQEERLGDNQRLSERCML